MGPKDFGVTTLSFQGHVTNRFAIDHCILVIHLHRASISYVFRDIRPQKTHVHTDTRRK